MNRYFQGERIVMAGSLKNEGTVTTSFNLRADLYSSFGKKVATCPLTIDVSTSKYYCLINTNNLSGSYHLKVVVVGESGDLVVSNNSITFNVDLPQCTI